MNRFVFSLLSLSIGFAVFYGTTQYLSLARFESCEQAVILTWLNVTSLDHKVYNNDQEIEAVIDSLDIKMCSRYGFKHKPIGEK